MTKTASQPQALKAAHTANNLSDVRCPQCGHFIIEGECLDSLTETPQEPAQTRVEPELRQISNSHFSVDSATFTLVSYDVTITDRGEFECTCAGYFYNRACKHIARVIASMPSPVAPAAPKRKLTLEDLFLDVA